MRTMVSFDTELLPSFHIGKFLKNHQKNIILRIKLILTVEKLRRFQIIYWSQKCYNFYKNQCFWTIFIEISTGCGDFFSAFRRTEHSRKC